MNAPLPSMMLVSLQIGAVARMASAAVPIRLRS